MSLAVAARIARRELRGGLKGFRVFLACLVLGVAAIAAIGTVRDGIEEGLADQGAVLLGGDAAIELTYQRATGAALDYLSEVSTGLSEVIDFRSMVALPDGSDRALTQVKAVDGAYPLYGRLELAPEMTPDEAFAGTGGRPGAVMAPLLVDRLGLSLGDTVRLGERDFVLMARIETEPDDASGGFALGPRTMVRIDDLEGSGLLQAGTMFDAEYRMTLPPGTELNALSAQVRDELSELAPRWRDLRNGAAGTREFVERLGSFLVLVGIAGLAVGGVGISSAVRAYMEEKTATIATLKTLGAEGRTIFLVYLIQIGALTLVGLVLGLALGALVPTLLAPVIQSALPIPAEIGFQLRPLAEAALYGALAALLFTLWPLSRAGHIRAAALFRDAATGMRGLPPLRFVILTGALLFVFVVIAAAFSGVALLAYWAFAGLFGAFLLLLAAGVIIRFAARRIARLRLLRGRPALRMAFAAVGGPGAEAGAVVLSLGLGLSVLAAIGQIDTNLRGAIQRELPDVAPSFFVVDIQPDQVDEVRARVDGDPAVSRVDAAPMLRGVITRINDQPATEFAPGHWVVRGDRGLTYSDALPERTTITQGAWWGEGYDGPPQISFAATEAEEIGLTLGDSVTINVLGREITGEVTSFRDVDFSTAGMGFILAMNPAALAGAPHSWLMTIYAEQGAEAAILRDLTRSHPNITVISVRGAIERASDLLRTIAAAVTYGALATLVTGFVVLIGAAAAGERGRTFEAAVLKTLGASRASVLLNFALRSVILGAGAGLVAVVTGGLAGWAIATFVMETSFVFDLGAALLVVAGGVLVTLLAGIAFAWRPLSVRPARVLRARE